MGVGRDIESTGVECDKDGIVMEGLRAYWLVIELVMNIRGPRSKCIQLDMTSRSSARGQCFSLLKKIKMFLSVK